MTLNPNKTNSLFVSTSRTVNLPHGYLVLSGISNIDIFGMKFDRRLTFEAHVCGIVSRVLRRICILRLVKRVFVDTCVASLLLFICSANPSAFFSGVGVCY